jgi:Xaa-Pro aminopeptidase
VSASALAPLDIAPRLARLRSSMKSAEIDALLVTKLANVRYLTGFTGSAAMLMVAPDDALFVTDGRYTEQSREQLEAAGVVDLPGAGGGVRIEIGLSAAAQHSALAAVVAPGTRLGLEEYSVTWAEQRGFVSTFEGVDIVPAGALVEALRRVKDLGEVDRIRRACAIGDEAFQALLPRLADGITERQFALELEFAMRECGASGNSFDPIIAAGPNGAKPHARPSDRVIARNELVVCDFGCIVDGYCSDMTRTVSLGDPGPDARHLYDVVLASQQAGRALVAADVACSDIDRASRDVIADAGWADAFSHSTGHGVGLEIHEAPRVAATGRDTLVVGDVVTVEPGVYLPGIGGVRIEDTVVVAATGFEPLTLTPKDLVL